MSARITRARSFCAYLRDVADLPADPAPVGVQVLPTALEFAHVPVYSGVSYCDAVRRAGAGEALRVVPGSIKVCQWAPVVLGLKAPEGRFEEGLGPRLDFAVAGLLLAPLKAFPGEPQAAIVRASPEALRRLIGAVGEEHLWRDEQGGLARSAVSLLTGSRDWGHHLLVTAVNRLLAALARSSRWQDLTQRLFRSTSVTTSFEAIISRTLADMSVCRNATVIPLTTGQANVSHFCTGGITWGRNRPDHLASGWPCRLPVHD